MTVASRELPLGAKAKVTNLKIGKTTDVGCAVKAAAIGNGDTGTQKFEVEHGTDRLFERDAGQRYISAMIGLRPRRLPSLRSAMRSMGSSITQDLRSCSALEVDLDALDDLLRMVHSLS